MGIKPKTSIMLVGCTLGGLVPPWLEHSANIVQWFEYSANIVQIVGSTPTWNAENLLSNLLTSGCIFL